MLCKLHIHIIALFGGLEQRGRGVEIGTPTPFLSLVLATDKPVQRGRPQKCKRKLKDLVPQPRGAEAYVCYMHAD